MAERRFTRSGDDTLSYLVDGDGPVVILIGGYGMAATWWVEDGYVDHLASDHRVIAVDPLGTGRSDGPLDVEAYGDDRLISHLAAVIESESVDDATLWGWARGASIAQLYARRRPRDLSLVVYAAQYLGDGRSPAWFDDHPTGELPRLYAALEADDWPRFWSMLPATPAWMRTRVERDNDPRVLAAVMRSAESRPVGFLPSSVPTLALWGSSAPYHRTNLELVESLPVEWAIVGGDSDLYRDADAVVAVVRPHLATRRTRRE